MVSSGKLNALLSVLAAALVVGCNANPPKPETAAVVAAPKTPAMRTFTNFTPALRCMDELLLAYGKRDIVITTVGIPDSTGKVQAGTKEMLISAISRMSVRSGALTFIELEGLSPELTQLFAEAAGAGVRKVPSYYVRGAISQLDENSIDSQQGAGLALPFLELGLSRDQVSSLVSVDLSIGESITRRILPETSTSNTMVTTRAGQSGDAGGRIGKAGFSINVALSQAEGMGSGIRSLIELGAIESIGKLAQVPYWKCLQVEKTNPAMMQQARDWYDLMVDSKRTAFVQSKLAGLKLYSGELDGQESRELRDAVARYQAANGLVASGRIDFDLYYSLQHDDQPLAADVNPTKAISAPAETKSTLTVRMDSDRGPKPAYRVNDALRAKVAISQNGTLYCYYRDAGGTLARIFPNRFAPEPYVKANQTLTLPADNAPFKIRFDRAGTEEVACFGSDRDMVLPAFLRVADLTPIEAGSMEDVSAAFRKANPAVAQGSLEITVAAQ